MPQQFFIECLDCGHHAPFSLARPACPRCGSLWREARYDYSALSPSILDRIAARPFDLWRYQELLPLRAPEPEFILGEGWTPLIPAVNLGMMLGNNHIYVKDERQGPTSSFKDRQAAMTVAALKEAGITEAVIASTGNVAIAYSAYAARAGIKLWAFLTSLVPPEKMREVAVYGTQVVKVTGTYDQAKQVAAEYARQRGLYLDLGTRSVTSVESMKTIAFEIAEQLAYRRDSALGRTDLSESSTPWAAPDWYIQAVSGGIGPLGVQKGFAELFQMGLIDRMPSLGLIQAEGCSPMVAAWKDGRETAEPVISPRTHISTLSTGNPGRAYTLLSERMHGGAFESVSDAEAFRTMHIMAKMEGISIEPAASVAFAGLIKLVREGRIQPDDAVVVNCSGHTISIEPGILGKGWARNVVIPAQSPADIPEEGLLAALNRVTEERYPRVLVVDDNADARVLIRRILQSQGNYTLFEATNGLEALSTAVGEIPDLIILDLMMPEMDGFSVLDALKGKKETSEIPVIVVTAKSLTKEEKIRLAGQTKKFLQKGDFLSDEFLDEIR
ncbi:MAG TPA: pyridoxal-phosphate dependent enzyme, partial [Anaerolineales bacterium]|nr:pyridoxal-phosphate dependent enzyme [Anaerolineales bacterium]